MAKTIGKLAEKTPEVGEIVSGLLVKKGFTYQIMAPDDLHVLLLLYNIDLSRSMKVESSTNEESGVPTLRVHEQVIVKQESENHLSLHWLEDPISDMVSHSVVALVLNVSWDMPKVSIESEILINEEEDVNKAEKIVHALLISLFGDVKFGDIGKLVITVDWNVAHLDKQTGDVECENEGLKERVRTAYRRIRSDVKPILLSAS
ncbi:hypothetical protein RND71_042318 [Anisodus tanguticus]|uniref:Pre-mRNA 3'-end-processing endonuclease polyadenylation factor C-term domain-containing protein n=1 Tax=Anisodus tanguticus TaxID=243964 RepID=A0AAE1QR77_9SOLA|nr:hypothetical protein RND71_042318 [Anisodus tanguticus]